MNKYRAWDKEKKRMLDVAVLEFNRNTAQASGIQHWIGGNTLEHIHANKVILMQSTGLKDKNGVDVYEGDVVNVSNHPFQKREDGLGVGMKINGNYEVGWNKEDLTYVAGSLLLFRIKSYISVVGNIHANPELLKEV